MTPARLPGPVGHLQFQPLQLSGGTSSLPCGLQKGLAKPSLQWVSWRTHGASLPPSSAGTRSGAQRTSSWDFLIPQLGGGQTWPTGSADPQRRCSGDSGETGVTEAHLGTLATAAGTASEDTAQAPVRARVPTP